MNEWLRDNLRPDQQVKLRRERTSIFAAWIRKAFGSKAFLMAMLQSGLNITPSGGSEHAHQFPTETARATKCLQELTEWLARFADTVVQHRNSESTQQARKRSGTKHSQSGLTAEQEAQRARRDLATQRIRQAQKIEAELKAYEERDYRRFRNPRSWHGLKRWERQAVHDLHNGTLQRECDAARTAHGGRVQAEPVRMHTS